MVDKLLDAFIGVMAACGVVMTILLTLMLARFVFNL